MLVRLQKLTPNDYLFFKSSGNSNNYSGILTIAKVISIANDSLKIGIFGYDRKLYHDDGLNYDALVAKLENEKGFEKIKTISNAELQEALPYVNEEENVNGKNLNDKQLILKSVKHFEGPILQFKDYNIQGNIIKFEIINIGFDATANKIESNDGKEWKLSGSQDFKFNKIISVKTVGGNLARIYFTDAQKKEFVFNIEKVNEKWQFSMVE